MPPGSGLWIGRTREVNGDRRARGNIDLELAAHLTGRSRPHDVPTGLEINLVVAPRCEYCRRRPREPPSGRRGSHLLRRHGPDQDLAIDELALSSQSEPAIPGASLLVVADEPEHAPIKRRTARTTIAFTTARMVNATP